MKNSIVSSIILIAALFCCQTMKAQDSDAPIFAMNKAANQIAASNTSSPLHQADSKPSYEFNINAGQHHASFEGLQEYISTHLIYPKKAIESSVQGKVIVNFEITAEGKVTNAIITQSLDADCDEAVLDLLYHMPNWKPAMNYGIPVKTKKMLEFSFGLN